MNTMAAKLNINSRIISLFIFFSVLVFLLVFLSRLYSTSVIDPVTIVALERDDLTLKLRWNKAYPGESFEDVKKGLLWALSYLGATIPRGSVTKAIVRENDTRFFLKLKELGFDQNAQNAFRTIISKMKSSEEYTLHGGIDVGRFIILTLNSTYHYYAITGAYDKLESFKEKYNFQGNGIDLKYSTVALGNRKIDVAEGDSFKDIAFIAFEGEGDISKDTFDIVEIETFDFFSNGQPKFALYSKQGKIKTGASAYLTRAGKPANCLWCHDDTFQPIHKEFAQPFATRMDANDYNAKINLFKDLTGKYRSNLQTDLDIQKKQDHVFMELLYLSFMEPSLYRLANEWKLDENEISKILAKYETHPHHEFKFLGDKLYKRREIEIHSPYNTLSIPSDPRETSEYEPNFFD